eukprot:Gregarina_sp_Poly_1__11077@NODE_890_length_5837_cov_53_476430_g634_i0_p3_GENE_NODE_890_length_5837_cov_53_476430_g634_i0NODE_890_length_5837_cov_53_476430_g634_i0_p3_ORF_typecomplete_len320_score21_05_NODE_890_length_5837_cov_53_476430_g634_i035894548
MQLVKVLPTLSVFQCLGTFLNGDATQITNLPYQNYQANQVNSFGQWLHETIHSIADSASQVIGSFVPLQDKMEGFTIYESRDYWKSNDISPELADRASLALQASGVGTVTTRQVTKLNEALYISGATLSAYQRALNEQYHKLSARDFEEFIRHSQIEIDHKIRQLFAPIHPHSFHTQHPCFISNTVFDHIVRALCVPFVIFESCRQVLELPHLDHHALATREFPSEYWLRWNNGRFPHPYPVETFDPRSPILQQPAVVPNPYGPRLSDSPYGARPSDSNALHQPARRQGFRPFERAAARSVVSGFGPLMATLALAIMDL